MLSPSLVITVSFTYLFMLFAVAYLGDKRAETGQSIIASPWVYALSMAVYCTAWTYFGSVGRAASAGVWFLPIYLGPMLSMILAWLVVRKMIRIAKTYRITSIADFIASRYGKSPSLAGLVTIITVVGIVPYIALQLKAISSGYEVMTTPVGGIATPPSAWWSDGTLYMALILAGFTIIFGTRHLDSSERHEGMVAAIAFESVVKLVAFLAVGIYVTYGIFDGMSDIFSQASAIAEIKALLTFDQGHSYGYTQWFALTLLAMLSVIFLPRQFQIMVVENVDEQHLKRAVWVFPLYLLLINIFVLPIALGGLLYFGNAPVNAETFVLSLPLAQGQNLLALFVFVGGLSAVTGMVIVEVIAISTMVCNDLVMPVLLRTTRFGERSGGDLTRLLLLIRRIAIIGILLLGYLYFHLAGEAYALVSIGLISFAAVAQFSPAILGGMYWKGGTRDGALTGLLLGFLMWTYTLMLPSLAKSGWISADFLNQGLFGIEWLKPEQFLGLAGLDNLTHSLFWSLFVNIAAYVVVSLWKRPTAHETSQALLFVDVFQRTQLSNPVFWQGQAKVTDLLHLTGRFMGETKAQRLFTDYAQKVGAYDIGKIPEDAALVQFVETHLTGAIGSVSARIMVASVVEEEALELDDVMRILEEASQLRAYSEALEEKSRSLEQATKELQAANEQLKSLDRLKDNFMSSVTHELRTPLTSIRAMTELMLDDPSMEEQQRLAFLSIVVSESERLSRLVNQVLDMAKIEAGHAEWHNSDVDILELVTQSVHSISGIYKEHGAILEVHAQKGVPLIRADADRLTQVLLNLLSNAVKFVPEENGRVEVYIRDATEGITVEVIDNGVGIAAEKQALVFEKFRQIEGETDRQPGTGLGLPISRQIVEHFGGRMWLQSKIGEGACFGFFLPR
ncbi:sensor histidine kinase [Colwellia psychrerythraea]|uniref:histidine kinase n=1 Tax=Colwellia psychrerythraea TaxID=28229 RepID=A0A099KTF1_COLPS|nr:sensor histidine kinase [Colwellia psychrerythraea]KGJ94044.1 integral membrane sensor signal transduction histidine kinase [Colwellia psychrerythraea]